MMLFYKTLKSSQRVMFKLHSGETLSGWLITNNVRLCATEAKALQKISIRSMRGPHVRLKNVLSWCLLVIPVSAFGLGTWQLFRWREKEEINQKFLDLINLPPVDFPKNLDELKDMEYKTVRVKGRFDHSKELYMGPRPHVTEDSYKKPVSLLSVSNAGYLVVTPFTLSDRDLTIMVNRGWVPSSQKLPGTRQQGQITEEVEIVGVVRSHQTREPLGSKNIPEVGYWVYRDLHKMSEYNGAAPIFLDAVRQCNVPGGPDGGQTIVQIKNDHFSYLLTWYGLFGVSGYMWFLRHFQKPPIIV